MAQVTVTLRQAERDALVELAERERRDPRNQAALIIVRELVRLGLVTSESTTSPLTHQPCSGDIANDDAD